MRPTSARRGGPRAARAGGRRRRRRGGRAPSRSKASASADHVLALDQRAEAEEGRALAVPAELRAGAPRPGGAKASRSTPQSAIESFALARPGSRSHEAVGEPAGVGDHGGRPRHDPLGRARDARDRGRGWRRPGRGPSPPAARRPRGRPARRRARPGTGSGRRRRRGGRASPPRPRRGSGSRTSSGPPAAAERGDLDLVARSPRAPRTTGTRKLPRSGSSGAGPHLGDEKDPHRATRSRVDEGVGQRIWGERGDRKLDAVRRKYRR